MNFIYIQIFILLHTAFLTRIISNLRIEIIVVNILNKKNNEAGYLLLKQLWKVRKILLDNSVYYSEAKLEYSSIKVVSSISKAKAEYIKKEIDDYNESLNNYTNNGGLDVLEGDYLLASEAPVILDNVVKASVVIERADSLKNYSTTDILDELEQEMFFCGIPRNNSEYLKSTDTMTRLDCISGYVAKCDLYDLEKQYYIDNADKSFLRLSTTDKIKVRYLTTDASGGQEVEVDERGLIICWDDEVSFRTVKCSFVKRNISTKELLGYVPWSTLITTRDHFFIKENS